MLVVMDAICGDKGVKAGFTRGKCEEDLAAAVDGLITAGVSVIILGCTELPLLLPSGKRVGSRGEHVQLVDPTDVLARQCVACAKEVAV